MTPTGPTPALPPELLLAFWRALDTIGIGAVLIEATDDGKLRLLSHNDAYLRIYRSRPAPGDQVNRLGYEVFRADRQRPLPVTEWPSYRCARSREVVQDVALHLRRADGSWRILSFGGVPISTEQAPNAAIGFIVDLTEIHEAQAEVGRSQAAMARSQAELQRMEERYHHAQKLESIGRLVGGVAHDFNNLLTAILGSGEMLRERLARGEPAGAEEEVEDVLEAARSAAELTRPLLDVVRRDAPRPRPVQLADELHRLEKLLRRTLGEEVILTLHAEAGLWAAWCDPGQVQQIVLNLAVNARDAMPGGGEFAISIANAAAGPPPDPAAGPVAEPGPHVCISVSDSGPGLPPAVLARLFEPFVTTKPSGLGTGLGLSTVHDLVEKNGGAIRVASAAGVGTRFDVYLPRSEVAPSNPPARPVGTMRGSGAVLVVEDDPLVLELTQRALQFAGYAVSCARRVSAALRQVEALRDLRLVIADVLLRDGDGREVASAALRVHPAARVVFMSGHPADMVVEHGVDPGAAEFLAKPFTASELLAKVEAVLAEGARCEATPPGGR